MSSIVTLPEKRNGLGQDWFPEQPQEKHAKLDDPYPGEVYDTAMELKDNSNSEESKSGGGSSTELDDDIEDYCEICRGHVGHECWDCPYKSKGIGWGCIECYGPCKKEDGDPSEHWSIEMFKQCVVCGNMGNHWADDCPYRSDAQVDDAGTSDHDGLGF